MSTAAQPAWLFHQAAPLAAPAEVPLGLTGRPTEVGGVACRYYRKELIRVGKYVHPAFGWALDVTPARLQAWADGHKRLSAAGVKVPCPLGHAGPNLGWLLDVERDGDRLFGTLQLIGDDAHRAAARNDVSVCVRPDFKDGTGTSLGEVLEHVALVPDPVVPGQSPFVPLAASRDRPAGVALSFELSAEPAAPAVVPPPPTPDAP